MSFINSQLNLLSVFDECAKLVGASSGLLVAAASTLLPNPIDIYMGEEFCIFVNMINVFGMAYGIFGGTGIALMRFVLIKCPSKVTGKIGKRRFAQLICLATIIMTSVSLYVWINWSFMQDKENRSLCLPLLNSKGSGAAQHQNTSGLWQKLLTVGALIGIGSISAELSMYVLVYKFLIANDRSMKLVLPSTAVSKRVRKNVISLTGHAINFAAETLWTIILLIVLIDGMPTNPDHIFYLYIYDISIHAILSGLHILFSRPLRAECLKICLSFVNLIPSHGCLEVFIKFSRTANTVHNLTSNTFAPSQEQA